MCSTLYGCVSHSKSFEQGYSLLLENLIYLVSLIKDELNMCQNLLQPLIEHILKLKVRVCEENNRNLFKR